MILFFQNCMGVILQLVKTYPLCLWHLNNLPDSSFYLTPFPFLPPLQLNTEEKAFS